MVDLYRYVNSSRSRFVKDGKVKAIRDFVKFLNGLNSLYPKITDTDIDTFLQMKFPHHPDHSQEVTCSNPPNSGDVGSVACSCMH